MINFLKAIKLIYRVKNFRKMKGYTIQRNTHINPKNILIFIENLDFDKIKDTDVFRNDDGSIKQIQHLEIFDYLSNIGNDLIKRNNINGEIVNMQVFIKNPGSKMTKPHQDGAYFKSDNYLTFWIPLCDVDENNSCLRYLDYSHEMGLLNHKENGNNFRIRSGVPGYSLEYDIEDVKNYTPIVMKAGDILCHHPYTLHYSDINKTNNKRYALTCIVKILNS